MQTIKRSIAILIAAVLTNKWQSRFTLAALCLLLSAGSAQAEPPHAQLRAFAPGGIAIDWEHPSDGAQGITLEREAPAFTWVFTALNNSFNDLGLQPSRVYRYRVCAKYAQLDCTPWLTAQTLNTPAPYSPPDVPSFTNVSAGPNNITVNWTSSASYSFHQVRWAENGHPDGQNKVNGRSFTVNGLRPGTYHFIVQGCNSTLLGSSCSRYSAPIQVATFVPPPAPAPAPAPAKGTIYGITESGDLLWYHHNGQADGTFRWASNNGAKVGSGWNFKQVFSGGDGVIYGVEPIVQPNVQIDRTTPRPSGGNLKWYRHDGQGDGTFRWASNNGAKVGTGWNFKQMFSGGEGVIYGITDNGDLIWYRHDGWRDGTFRWASYNGVKVGSGWNFKQVFSGGEGVIYGITDNGDLLWYRHDGWRDGTFRWASNNGAKVGNGWNFKQVFSAGNGVIYGVEPIVQPNVQIGGTTPRPSGGNLKWYRHDGWRDGTFRWASNNGATVGTGWNFKQVFSQ